MNWIWMLIIGIIIIYAVRTVIKRFSALDILSTLFIICSTVALIIFFKYLKENNQ